MASQTFTPITTGRGGWIRAIPAPPEIEGPYRSGDFRLPAGMTIGPDDDAWYAGTDEYVAVRFEMREKRLRAVELWTPFPDAANRLTLSKVEGAVNGPDLRTAVLARMSEKTTPQDEARRWSRAARAKGKGARGRSVKPSLIGLILDGVDLSRKPDSFYVRVANMYAALQGRGSHKPAALIAEANGVAVERVRGWIREARQRGLLPPAGRPGRAG